MIDLIHFKRKQNRTRIDRKALEKVLWVFRMIPHLGPQECMQYTSGPRFFLWPMVKQKQNPMDFVCYLYD